MPKEPAATSTRQPPKHQTPARTPPQTQGPAASTPQGDVVLRALSDPAALTPADVAALQRAVGNRAVQRLLARPEPPEAPEAELVVQTKLVVGAAEDALEREAEATAQAITRHSDETADPGQIQRAVAAPTSGSVVYDADEEREEEATEPRLGALTREAPQEEDKLRRKTDAAPAIGRAGGAVDASVERTIDQARGGGQPLPGKTRAAMEGAFDADFSRVRVHTSPQSDELNRKLSARAFTTGQDVFFKQGEYSPQSTAGKSLLAHELTHVVQQNGAAVRRKPNKQAPPRSPAAATAAPGGLRAQRAVWDYASLERKKWKERNTATKAALLPLGGLIGAGTGAAAGYQSLYQRLRGEQGANASGWRRLGAGLGAGVLGTLALPFTAGWGALRGAVSGLANPLISGAKRVPGLFSRAGTSIRQAMGQFRGVPNDQRRPVDGSSPLPETEAEKQSRLAALIGRRGSPDTYLGGPRSVELNRGENLIASSTTELGGSAASGVSATAATARTLTSWASGATDTSFGSSLTGATSAFGSLGGIAGMLGATTALIDAGTGVNQARDTTRDRTDRGLGAAQGVSSTGDAVKQSAVAAFNIASLTGNAAAAAAATVVAGGAGVVMGVIDILRGTTGALTADKRHTALLAIIDETERDASLSQIDKVRIITAAREGAKTQKARMETAGMTTFKGALTVTGGAVLIAAGLTNPVGWALLGGAALVGGIYALYKLRDKSKRKRQVATRELGIQSWRDRWKAKKKFVEDTTTWGSQERRDRMRSEVGEDPLLITLRSQGYESPGHFYARYIKTTAQTLYDNAVAGPEPNPQNRDDDVRGQMVKVIEAMGLRIDRSKDTHTPTVKRIAEALDN